MSLLDDTELWWEKQNLLWACHASRSKNRVNSDGSFVQHQIGAIITLSKRLVPTQGRKSRQDGGVAEKSNGPISRPAEDAPSKHTQLPIELLAK